ncbi:MAG: hypothetical protein ACRCVV_12020 [Shewanella sp.]
MKKLIGEAAIACDISERKLRLLLTELGLAQMLNEARRMQVRDAYQDKRIVFDNEPIPARHIKQAFESLRED